MKKFLLFIIISAIFYSCRKDNITASQNTVGDITGLMVNGRAWPLDNTWHANADGGISQATQYCNFTYSSISIFSFENIYARENLLFLGLPLQSGTTVLNYIESDTSNCYKIPTAKLYLQAEDGDVTIGYYKLSSNVPSKIIITSYDSVTGVVSGTFDATFIKKEKNSSYYNNYPDSLHFSGGQFHTKWIK